MSFPHAKYIHLTPVSLQILTHSSINSKFKISLSISSSESFKSHHPNDLSQIWWDLKYSPLLNKILHLRIYETRKQVICFQNTVVGHLYDRHSHSEREDMEEVKGRWFQGSWTLIGKCHRVSTLENIPLWFNVPSRPTVVLSCRPVMALQSHSSLCLKSHKCL